MSLFRMLRLQTIKLARTFYTSGEPLVIMNERDFKFSYLLLKSTANLYIYSPNTTNNARGVGFRLTEIKKMGQIEFKKTYEEACLDLVQWLETTRGTPFDHKAITRLVFLCPATENEIRFFLGCCQALRCYPEIEMHLVSPHKTLPFDVKAVANDMALTILDGAPGSYGGEKTKKKKKQQHEKPDTFWVWRLSSAASHYWFDLDTLHILASWINSTTKTATKKHNSGGCKLLDVGTGNGILLHVLARYGFKDLTGTDYNQGVIDLATRLANRDVKSIKFLVDDILKTKMDKTYQVINDKGTLDAIGLHPNGDAERIIYWDAMSRLVAPHGLLIITSCYKTKDELVEEAPRGFTLVDHVRDYESYKFGGSVKPRVITVAFARASHDWEFCEDLKFMEI